MGRLIHQYVYRAGLVFIFLLFLGILAAAATVAQSRRPGSTGTDVVQMQEERAKALREG
jgi:ABC-type transporter Mla subunit MlaD